MKPKHSKLVKEKLLLCRIFPNFEIKYESSKMQSNMENGLERSDSAVNLLKLSKNNEYLKEFYNFFNFEIKLNFSNMTKKKHALMCKIHCVI